MISGSTRSLEAILSLGPLLLLLLLIVLLFTSLSNRYSEKIEGLSATSLPSSKHELKHADAFAVHNVSER